MTSEQIVNYALHNATFYHVISNSPRTYGDICARVSFAGSREAYAVSSNEFRMWLTHEIYTATTKVPRQRDISESLRTLEAISMWNREAR